MRVRVWIAVCALFLSTTAVYCQSPENAFRDAVLKKQMYLRGFSAEPKMQWRWNGTALVSDMPNLRTLGVLVADSVKIKSDRIEIKGKRFTELRDADQGFALEASSTPVEIDVNLHGTDAATVLPTLVSTLFYADRDEAVANVPEDYRKLIPFGGYHRARTRPMNKPKCDCADKGTDACADRSATEGLQRPHLGHQVFPEYSEDARRNKISGVVTVAFTVDETGHTMDLWLANPVGFGLDDEALKAVSQYVFAPATCHDKPVKAALLEDVSFRIFSRRP